MHTHHNPMISIPLLCFEVDKPSKILIKTSNAAEYIESNIQNIEALRIDDPISSMYEKNILTWFH